jgi:hypothetical protein
MYKSWVDECFDIHSLICMFQISELFADLKCTEVVDKQSCCVFDMIHEIYSGRELPIRHIENNFHIFHCLHYDLLPLFLLSKVFFRLLIFLVQSLIHLFDNSLVDDNSFISASELIGQSLLDLGKFCNYQIQPLNFESILVPLIGSLFRPFDIILQIILIVVVLFLHLPLQCLNLLLIFFDLLVSVVYVLLVLIFELISFCC